MKEVPYVIKLCILPFTSLFVSESVLQCHRSGYPSHIPLALLLKQSRLTPLRFESSTESSVIGIIHVAGIKDYSLNRYQFVYPSVALYTTATQDGYHPAWLAVVPTVDVPAQGRIS